MLNKSMLLRAMFVTCLLVLACGITMVNAAESNDKVMSVAESEKLISNQLDELKVKYSQGTLNEIDYNAQILLAQNVGKYRTSLLKKVHNGELSLEQCAKLFTDFGNKFDRFKNETEQQLTLLHDSNSITTDQFNTKFYNALVTFFEQNQLASAADENTKKASSSATGSSSDPTERLKKLKSLLDQGLITQTDYDTQRAVIIKSL